MNTINGQAYSYYGLEVLTVEGALDMPSRLGDTTYDWGDYIEPLVDEQDISWKERDIKIDVFFDGNRYGITFSRLLSRLEALPKEFVLNTNYGSYIVSLKEVIKQKGFTNRYAKLELVFNENKPQFTDNEIGLPIGGRGVSIDDFNFLNDFGIVVSEVKLLEDIPVLRRSNITVFNGSKVFTEERLGRKVELSCVRVYSDFGELEEAIGKFKKLLSDNGLRILIYGGRSYSCFLTEGFTVKGFKTHIKFDLRLNITGNSFGADFVRKGFIEEGFVM